MLQLISQLTNQLHNMQTQQAQDRENSQAQMRQLQESIQTLRQNQLTPLTTAGPNPYEFPLPDSPPNKSIPVPVPSVSHRMRAALPDPPKFSGNRSEFRTWYLEMEAKLSVDHDALGGSREQFAYIYSRLDRSPQNMASAYFAQGGLGANRDPTQFMEYLKSCYGDPNSKGRALERLRTLRQGRNESFGTFLPRFEKELAEAGGGQWIDEVKINYLSGGLHEQMRDRLINVPTLPEEYHLYVQTLQTIGSRLDSFSHDQRRSKSSQHLTSSDQANGQVKPVTQAMVAPDIMDWEPTKIRRAVQKDNEKLKGRRAKWVDKKEMDQRREENRCLRCGRSGCRTNICPLLPATPPRVTVNRAKPVMKAAVEDEDERTPSEQSDQTDYESSKE